MKEFKKNIKMTWKYAKGQKSKIVKYFISNCFLVVIGIVMPIISAKMIVSLTASEFEQLLYMCIVLAGVEILESLFRFFNQFLSHRIYRETFINIQTDLGKQMLNLETKCLDTNSSGVFIQRLVNDTDSLSEIFNTLNFHATRIITSLGVFSAIFIINKIAFIYIVVMVLSLFIINKIRVTKFNKIDKEYRERTERVTGLIGEMIRGMRDVKMLNASDSFINELGERIVDVNQKDYEMNSVSRNYHLFENVVYTLYSLGLMFLLIFLIINNKLEVANALVIYNYMGKVLNITYIISGLMATIKGFNLSASRIMEIIDGENFPKEHFGTKHLDVVNGDFEFKNVSFKYDSGNLVLDNINFKVNANETVAFVGKSGAGKTTIFNLLCKMYDLEDGQITIDGIDIRELDRDSLRNNITIINQNPYIFNLSIKENFRLIKEGITDEEIVEVCKLACLHDFIMSLPEQYDSLIGEGGINLSGGQKQRLAIARSFAQKTEIILLDEATSALDNETQSEIQKAIENLKKDYTILIIAHRLDTIINSDRILFLNDGKIEAEGTHQQLMKTCPNYRSLYELELKEN